MAADLNGVKARVVVPRVNAPALPAERPQSAPVRQGFVAQPLGAGLQQLTRTNAGPRVSGNVFAAPSSPLPAEARSFLSIATGTFVRPDGKPADRGDHYAAVRDAIQA